MARGTVKAVHALATARGKQAGELPLGSSSVPLLFFFGTARTQRPVLRGQEQIPCALCGCFDLTRLYDFVALFFSPSSKLVARTHRRLRRWAFLS